MTVPHRRNYVTVTRPIGAVDTSSRSTRLRDRHSTALGRRHDIVGQRAEISVALLARADGSEVRPLARGRSAAVSYPGGDAAHVRRPTAWRPGSLVSARITPLRLEAFEQLPKHARRCVFWEVDPSTLRRDDHLADPEFEKEAWLSMVMLEWGSCGQVAVSCEPDDEGVGDRRRDDALPGLRVLRSAARGAARARCSRPDRSAPTRCC